MKTINWKVIITATFCVFLTTACSKKLMPPEIETSAGVIEGTELTASSGSSENDFAGSGGSGDSGFFSEEPVSSLNKCISAVKKSFLPWRNAFLH